MNHDDPAQRYRHLASRFTDVVDAVPHDAWDRESPCDGWTVRDVLAHVVDTEREFLAQMQFGADIEASDDPIAGWRMVNGAMQRALDDTSKANHRYDGYFGPTTFGESVDTFYAGDLLVHGWDIARGAGLAHFEHLDAQEMATVRRKLEPVGDAVRGPGVFGPAIEPDPGASEQERFLAWVGRRA